MSRSNRRKGPGRSVIPARNTPGSSEKSKVLVVPEKGVLGALLAEPAIRAMAAGRGDDPEITVCHECADLFAGHPAVHVLAYSDPGVAELFDRIVTLSSGQGKGNAMDKIYEYAEQAGVHVQEREPRVFLNSFDLIRVQRFGLGRAGSPRIAVALPAGLRGAELEAWRDLCRTLGEGMKAGVVLLGCEPEPEVPAVRDLRGKLMARETAAVLSQCDVLVSSEAEMLWMASAVQAPAVFVGSEAMARMVCPDPEHGVFVCAETPGGVIEAMSRLNERMKGREKGEGE